MTSWDELRDEFRRYVLRRGERTVGDVADEIGVARRTVYKLMQNPNRRPHRLVREAIERVCTKSQPDDTASE